MNQSKNPLSWLAYFILGLVVLLVAVQILKGVLWFIYGIATLVVSIAIVVAVGWAVYVLLRSASRTRQ